MGKHWGIAALVAAVIVSSSITGATPAEAAPITSEKLTSKIEKLLRQLPGDYAVSVRELDGEKRTASIRSSSRREPASSAKLFIAYAVYTKIDRGDISLNSRVSSGLTVRACLRAMIEPSDNYCAVELRNKVGNGFLNRLLAKNGYDDTHFWYSKGRTKVTSTSDMATLMTRLERGELLSKKSTTRFLKQLRNQVWRDTIASGLPANIVQASKPGALYVRSGMVYTDAAIVYGKKTRYVIAIMGYHGSTIHSLVRISKLVYSSLEGSFKKGFTYTKAQMKSTRAITLRSGPGRSASVIRSFPKGVKVQVISSRHRWYYVRAGGSVGWMLNSGLTLRNPIN